MEQNAERPIVYIREVAVAELPAEVREQAGELETLFAIGDEDGKQLALVADRKMAFAVARQNGTEPVSVHWTFGLTMAVVGMAPLSGAQIRDIGYLFLCLGLAGCVAAPPPAAEPDTTQPAEIVSRPFASAPGTHALPPYLLGWRCGPADGALIQILNGYRVYVTETELAHPNWELQQITVQPPDWPCALAFVGREPSLQSGLLFEVAWSGIIDVLTIDPSGGGPFPTVISVYSPLQPELLQAMDACVDRGETDWHCADEVATAYAGQGVSFEIHTPHPTRDGTANRFEVLMRNGRVSIHR